LSAPDRFAVIGHPVAHSQSPFIHAAFATQCGQALQYDRIEAPVAGFAAAAQGFFASGGRGLNVTVPFKPEAYALAQELSPRAERAQAVNTLSRQPDGRLVGDNTDGVGLIRDLMRIGAPVRGRRVVLLGAGGAVRGVLGPLLELEPESILLVNRRVDRAEALAGQFADLAAQCHCRLNGLGYDGLSGRVEDLAADLLINGTSASLAGELPPLPDALLGPGACAYDMAYAAEATPFQRWAAVAGAAASHDGLGMLVEQAAESFWIWRGVRPETGPVLAALRSRLRG